MSSTIHRGLAGCLLACLTAFAHANGQGEAILRVSDLKLLNTAGAQYTTADFGQLQTWARYVNGNAVYTQSVANEDLDTSCSVGLPGRTCNPQLSNYFEPFAAGGYSFYPDNYRNADQRVSGALIAATAMPMSVDTRADLGINKLGERHDFNSFSTVDMRMTFRLATADSIQLSFAGDSYVKVWNTGTGDYPSFMQSEVGFQATLVNATTGAVIFDYAPDELNYFVAPADATDLHDPGMKSFSVASGLLNTTDEYTFTLSQVSRSFGNSIVSSVPEPSGALMLAAGLALLGAARRAARRPG